MEIDYKIFETLYRPAQLRGHEVAVRRELGRTPVHLADQSFPARFRHVAQLLEHGVDPRQQGAVERVVVGQKVRAGRYVVEHFKVFGLVLGVVIARLQFGVGHRGGLAVLRRIPTENNMFYTIAI